MAWGSNDPLGSRPNGARGGIRRVRWLYERAGGGGGAENGGSVNWASLIRPWKNGSRDWNRCTCKPKGYTLTYC